jgi:ElaB/YqjD/DUF883 family membrane-anchored ribosome-binding protein
MNDECIEPDEIRQQMEQTRESLQSKLVTLQQQVKDTVQEATGAVEAVKETVVTVKDTVQGTVETVKDTVQDTVDTVQEAVGTVKDSLDLGRHVQEHPWLMVGGAALVGFVGTRLLSRIGEPAPTASPAQPKPAQRNGHAASIHASAPPEPKRTWWDMLGEHYGDELTKLKGLAVGTVGGVVREMVVANVGPALADQVKEVLDSFTTKLGGKVINGPILKGSPGPEQNSDQQSYEHLDMAMEKSLVSGRW